jgi:hypothetical protein
VASGPRLGRPDAPRAYPGGSKDPSNPNGYLLVRGKVETNFSFDDGRVHSIDINRER